MKRENNNHRRALEKIALSPRKLGIDDVISASIEQNLYDGRRLVSQTDVIFEELGKHVHIIEYKGNGNGEMLDRARKQLERAVWWYSRFRPDIPHDHIHTRIISGDDPKYKSMLK